MARRKLPGGLWEELGPGANYPPELAYPPSRDAPRPARRVFGRPRALTPDVRKRAHRVARLTDAPKRRRVALTVLELDSVSSAAEVLGMTTYRVYGVLSDRP